MVSLRKTFLLKTLKQLSRKIKPEEGIMREKKEKTIRSICLNDVQQDVPLLYLYGLT